MDNSGVFITVEGTEGVGKSTQCELLCDGLKRRFNRRVLVTREPGGTALGESVRALLLDPDIPAMHGTAELLLLFAARAEHLERVIRPALDDGVVVVCDRFTDATYAYQGGGRGLDQSLIAALENLVQGELRPDLTFILDLDVTTAVQRTADRGDLDRFEREQADFFERVRAVYLERARSVPERAKIIDASGDVDAVQARMLNVVAEYLR